MNISIKWQIVKKYFMNVNIYEYFININIYEYFMNMK